MQRALGLCLQARLLRGHQKAGRRQPPGPGCERHPRLQAPQRRRQRLLRLQLLLDRQSGWHKSCCGRGPWELIPTHWRLCCRPRCLAALCCPPRCWQAHHRCSLSRLLQECDRCSLSAAQPALLRPLPGLAGPQLLHRCRHRCWARAARAGGSCSGLSARRCPPRPRCCSAAASL